jgi:hypothetical protein
MIEAKATGPSFFYRELHEWKFVDELGAKWFKDTLYELAGKLQKLADKGVGNITAELTQVWDGVPQTLVVENLSKADVAKFEQAFVDKYQEIVNISKKRYK